MSPRFVALVLILLIQVTLGKMMSNIRGGNQAAMMNGAGPKNDTGVDRPARMTNHSTLDHMPFMENHTMDYRPLENHTMDDRRPMLKNHTMDHERLQDLLNHTHQEHFFESNHTAGGRDNVPGMNHTGSSANMTQPGRGSKFIAFVKHMFGN